MSPTEKRELANKFLERWPAETISKMTLDDYTDVNNHDTFCYWLETATKQIGSINNFFANKFGIYKISNHLFVPKSREYYSDNIHRWKYDQNKFEAFNIVKNKILKIIEAAQTGNWKAIDEIQFHEFPRWKIAMLYSNENLIPIFSNPALNYILKNYFGVENSNRLPTSVAQSVIMKNKPDGSDFYAYGDFLWKFYEDVVKFKKEERVDSQPSNKERKRKPATDTGKNTYSFTISQKDVFVTKYHSLIQDHLYLKLQGLHPNSQIYKEANYVDIKVEHTDSDHIDFYEIKTDPDPRYCIRHGIGQLLDYCSRDSDHRQKRLIIVGTSPIQEKDIEFIEYLRGVINFEISYLPFDLSDLENAQS